MAAPINNAPTRADVTASSTVISELSGHRAALAAIHPNLSALVDLIRSSITDPTLYTPAELAEMLTLCDIEIASLSDIKSAMTNLLEKLVDDLSAKDGKWQTRLTAETARLQAMARQREAHFQEVLRDRELQYQTSLAKQEQEIAVLKRGAVTMQGGTVNEGGLELAPGAMIVRQQLAPPAPQGFGNQLQIGQALQAQNRQIEQLNVRLSLLEGKPQKPGE
ncbi:hypothetical protein K490DRAFT_56880 [Saccharata proteae CBS 121410]|uniref:Uncharacterized protein n=1 Tax=Saccharata proteae CBS 121410 TaxID=1314787 RepID=A0A9P4LZU1_9PEZI|nr:hypothetical protein K490DRAFT_56880 [Saccharata proteae CBS 121410]